jgi:hypothetical protein
MAIVNLARDLEHDRDVALNDQDAALWMLVDSPELAALHGDPRYHDLLRRMHLEP